MRLIKKQIQSWILQLLLPNARMIPMKSEVSTQKFEIGIEGKELLDLPVTDIKTSFESREATFLSHSLNHENSLKTDLLVHSLREGQYQLFLISNGFKNKKSKPKLQDLMQNYSWKRLD